MKKVVLILYFVSGISFNFCINDVDDNCTSFTIFVSADFQSLEDKCCEDLCICKCCKTMQIIDGIMGNSNSTFIKNSLFTNSSDILVETYSNHWQPPNVFLS